MRNLELPGRSPVQSPQAMAATSHTLSTQVAIDILKAGGNALDAAIAAAACQNVVEPGSTGIGGDCFCLYAPEGKDRIIAFNGSGRAPQAASADDYKNAGITAIKRNSPHAVTVPGAVDAWWQLNKDYGRLSFGDLLQPAIAYARDGYPITSRVYRDFISEKEAIAAEPSTASIFMPGGKIPSSGSRHYQKKLAKTLEKIARDGRDGFYTGDVAQDIVSYLAAKGGLHTTEDFANAGGDYVTPIKTRFRGYDIHECPPNGQGLIALLLLNIMSGIDIDRAKGALTQARIHQEIEACRMAYASRDHYLADPVHADVPVKEILSPEYASRLRAEINPDKAGCAAANIALSQHKDTVYITVIDKERNACSLINTIFWGFGSCLTAPKSGVLLQNRAMGFSLNPAHPNCIAGGKRPLHTIIPAIATENGRVVLSFGVMGGQYQAFGQMQFLTRFLDYGYDIQEAMDLPRFMVHPDSGQVEMEGTIPSEIKAGLRAMGHHIVAPKAPIGGSQAIWIDWKNDLLTGGSDPRKDGCALGY